MALTWLFLFLGDAADDPDEPVTLDPALDDKDPSATGQSTPGGGTAGVSLTAGRAEQRA